MVITSLSSGYDLQHRIYLLEIHSLWTREVGIAGMTRCPLPRPSRPSRQQPASSGHGCASGASNWGCPRRLWPTSPNCTGRSSARSSAVSATSASTTSCASLVPWTSIPAIWCEGCDDQRVETVWSCASQYWYSWRPRSSTVLAAVSSPGCCLPAVRRCRSGRSG